ncbi:MAG: glycosyltransferase [Lachnospiraceae bacterium]|nr:glycosyltransferase [Lachnospiraceae bacterium]
MILLFSSRILCYESNLVFIKKMSEALNALGEETRIIELDNDWEKELSEIPYGKYKALIDFNSLLPRMENDDGSPYLDGFDAPFFNYVVDHPMYHHPGITRKIKNNNVLCVDTCHVKYIKDNYPDIKKCVYLPLTGEAPLNETDFSKRKYEILVMATMTDENLIYNDIMKFPKEYQTYMKDICELMMENPYTTQEDVVKAYIKNEGLDVSNKDFPLFMNNICMADKLARYRRREKFVTSLIKEDLPVTLVGNGWENTLKAIPSKRINYVGDVGFNVSYTVMANSKMLVNLSPEFHGGVHDRVYSAMSAGCAVVTDHNDEVEKEFDIGQNIVTYDRGDVFDFTEKVAEVYENAHRMHMIGEEAKKYHKKYDTWEQRMIKFLDLLL